MYLEEFSVGQTWPISAFRMEKDKIIEFGKEYDPMPFHVDEKLGKQTRFGGLIASGPQTYMTFWTRFIHEHDPFGSELIAGMSNHMEWPQPTYPDDELQGEVEVVKVEPRNPYNGIVEIAMRAFNQDGKTVLTGGARILIARRS